MSDLSKRLRDREELCRMSLRLMTADALDAKDAEKVEYAKALTQANNRIQKAYRKIGRMEAVVEAAREDCMHDPNGSPRTRKALKKLDAA